MPHLQELVKRHQKDPFVLLAINHRDSPEDFRKGMADYQVTWPTIYQGSDQNGPTSPISKLYQVRGYPTYFLIGPDGKILGTGHNGAAFDQQIAKWIQKIKAQENQ